jgi:hypothetical protein
MEHSVLGCTNLVLGCEAKEIAVFGKEEFFVIFLLFQLIVHLLKLRSHLFDHYLPVLHL